MLKQKSFLLTVLLVFAMMLVACGGSAETEHNHDTMSEDGDHADGHAGHGDEHEERIPNEGGASINIISPTDGDVLPLGDIEVEVEVENFTLGEDDNHWHVYTNGTSYGMVVGANLDEFLRDLGAGEHMISVYLANGEHQEFEDGDSITITIEE